MLKEIIICAVSDLSRYLSFVKWEAGRNVVYKKMLESVQCAPKKY